MRAEKRFKNEQISPDRIEFEDQAGGLGFLVPPMEIDDARLQTCRISKVRHDSGVQRGDAYRQIRTRIRVRYLADRHFTYAVSYKYGASLPDNLAVDRRRGAVFYGFVHTITSF